MWMLTSMWAPSKKMLSAFVKDEDVSVDVDANEKVEYLHCRYRTVCLHRRLQICHQDRKLTQHQKQTHTLKT